MPQNNINLSDNTTVATRPRVVPKILTEEQKKELQRRQLEEDVARTRTNLYDADKYDYYRNMQNFYNQNVFGYGIEGNQTAYNPNTQQRQIQSNYDYSKSKATQFMSDLAGAGIGAGVASSVFKNGWVRGLFPVNKNLGKLEDYIPYKIGEGAEAVVVKNNPNTVGKISQIPLEEMVSRNAVPHTEPSKFIGYTDVYGEQLPTYIQRMLKIPKGKSFNKYLPRLDRMMKRKGYRKVDDPNIQYRAYTNGETVIDDVAPGNVGVDWLGRPRMIDFNMQTVPEWISQGFHLKQGGKL